MIIRLYIMSSNIITIFWLLMTGYELKYVSPKSIVIAKPKKSPLFSSEEILINLYTSSFSFSINGILVDEERPPIIEDIPSLLLDKS